jgi:hypothetical protein
VEFEATGPRIWYPWDRRHIVIQLNTRCMTDWYEAHFQLAHECIHLLSPTGRNDSNILEEGLATSFSLDYMKRNLGRPDYGITDHRYISAVTHFSALMTIQPDAIRELRELEPTISRIDANTIIQRYPDIDPLLAETLASRFST